MTQQNNQTPEHSTLGKQVAYDAAYNPDILFSIPRKENRNAIAVPDELPFSGIDLWNHYEVSWLNEKGKPIAALAEIQYDCASPFIIESKSMKLYFNSLNNAKFKNAQHVQETVSRDLSKKINHPVQVKLTTLKDVKADKYEKGFDGICIDDLDVSCDMYVVTPAYLKAENEIVEEVLYSDLLKSNCPVTNQPDWGSVKIAYKGKKLNREGLLRYIVSFRNHNEFHEQCIERIFMDIKRCSQPESLTVSGRYTRRGGLDINPVRSTGKVQLAAVKNIRLCRQ